VVHFTISRKKERELWDLRLAIHAFRPNPKRYRRKELVLGEHNIEGKAKESCPFIMGVTPFMDSILDRAFLLRTLV
jgi:hypothetical protein